MKYELICTFENGFTTDPITVEAINMDDALSKIRLYVGPGEIKKQVTCEMNHEVRLVKII